LHYQSSIGNQQGLKRQSLSLSKFFFRPYNFLAVPPKPLLSSPETDELANFLPP
jgi:hypothetical protein